MKSLNVFMLFALLHLTACRQDKPLSVVRVAVPSLFSSSLVFLAKELKYFEDEGIDLQLKVLPYGKDCLERMLENEFDLSAVYTSPLAKNILEDKKISIITELHSSSNNTKLIYRKDLVSKTGPKINNIKIGLVEDTNAEFLLSLYLAVNSIDPKNNTIVNHDIRKLEDLLLDGSLQAAVFWQPTVSRILLENPKTLEAMENAFYTDFSALVANREFVNNHKNDIYSIVKALIKAKDFLNNNPEKSTTMIIKYLDDKSIADNSEILKYFKIKLGLSQMFNVMLRSEINWNKKLFSKERFILDESPIFRSEFLRKYLPESVTLE